MEVEFAAEVKGYSDVGDNFCKFQFTKIAAAFQFK